MGNILLPRRYGRGIEEVYQSASFTALKILCFRNAPGVRREGETASSWPNYSVPAPCITIIYPMEHTWNIWNTANLEIPGLKNPPRQMCSMYQNLGPAHTGNTPPTHTRIAAAHNSAICHQSTTINTANPTIFMAKTAI